MTVLRARRDGDPLPQRTQRARYMQVGVVTVIIRCSLFPEGQLGCQNQHGLLPKTQTQ